MERRIPSSHPSIPERSIKAFRDRCFIFSQKASTIFTQSMRRNSINGLRHFLQPNRPYREEPSFPLHFPSKFLLHHVETDRLARPIGYGSPSTAANHH